MGGEKGTLEGHGLQDVRKRPDDICFNLDPWVSTAILRPVSLFNKAGTRLLSGYFNNLDRFPHFLIVEGCISKKYIPCTKSVLLDVPSNLEMILAGPVTCLEDD